MKEIELGKMIVDYSIYPRASVDSQQISYLREADDAGAELPPIVVEKGTNRIVDGVHRHKMWLRKYDDKHKVPVIEKRYENEGELLLDAIRLNAPHGRMLDSHDKTHCIILAEKLHIPESELASALSITVDKVGKLRLGRIGELHIGKTVNAVALKNTIRHMNGRILTKEQSDANNQLGGMNQIFYVNQIILLLDNNLVDWGNENLIAKMAILRERLNNCLKMKKAKSG